MASEYQPPKDPLGSYIRDLTGSRELLTKANGNLPKAAAAEECLRNVREKFLHLQVPKEKVPQVMVELGKELVQLPIDHQHIVVDLMRHTLSFC